MKSVRAALAAIAEYLAQNPGAASMFGGFAVLGLAKLGFNVSEAQLYAIVAVLLPLIAGGHLAARSYRSKLFAQRMHAALAQGHVVLSQPAEVAPAEPHIEVPDSPEGIDEK
jgi:hypothetical protein